MILNLWDIYVFYVCHLVGVIAYVYGYLSLVSFWGT